MKRFTIKPRRDWVQKVEENGLIYHHTGDGVYWNESAYYKFSSKEVDIIEAATNNLQEMAIAVGQNIIDNRRYAELGIPDRCIPAIEYAWKEEPPAIYGRMDLAYDGINPPKLLEYNADTPTALLEASVAQWFWKQELFGRSDQFNSIHERLVAKWKELKDYLTGNILYVAHINDPQGEDTMTATYMRDTAEEAGLKTEGIIVSDIGWNGRCFVDVHEKPIRSIFKLYPWEWMVHEKFGNAAIATYNEVQWIEPIWKMLLSNKAILPILWEMYPGHPNLLPAYFDGPRDLAEFVKKPKMSREGANIIYHTGKEEVKTEGDYGTEGYIYQGMANTKFGDNYMVLGSWVIDQISAGIGVRESVGPITNNLSTFVPHIFE